MTDDALRAADTVSPERIVDGLKLIGLSDTRVAAATEPLRHYIAELREDSERYGLIARGDVADAQRLFVRHILDSIAPWPHIVDLADRTGRRRLYDLGAGAGLPGVPLGIALGDALDETVLVERRSRRVSFLLGAAAKVSSWTAPGAAPLRVVEEDATLLGKTEGARLSGAVVVFRAYQKTTPELLRALSTTFGPDTPVCAWKGRHDRTEAERRIVAASPHAADARMHIVEVPGEEAQRSLLVWGTR